MSQLLAFVIVLGILIVFCLIITIISLKLFQLIKRMVKN